jgi:hypothetical protein
MVRSATQGRSKQVALRVHCDFAFRRCPVGVSVEAINHGPDPTFLGLLKLKDRAQAVAASHGGSQQMARIIKNQLTRWVDAKPASPGEVIEHAFRPFAARARCEFVNDAAAGKKRAESTLSRTAQPGRPINIAKRVQLCLRAGKTKRELQRYGAAVD